ncbi:MAG: lipid-A-disaccharide synthase [Candidatus Caenarcaniphilales bacterium]|nr:lipid-A-disaccharide synthase [Candidatus Caenarcaniphilales bacterium]
MTSLNLFISSGSQSNDAYTQQVIKSLQEQMPPDAGLKLWGIGGQELKKQNVEIIQDSSIFDLNDPISFLKNIFSLIALENKLIQELKTRKPDMALLVNNSIVNLRLAALIKKHIPFCKVIYYIAPQVWAWNEKRIKEIPNLIDRLLTVLPFEEPLHREFGTSAKFIGHPAVWELIEEDGKSFNRKKFLSSLEINNSNKVIALCPGSKQREIEQMLPVFIEAAKDLIKRQAKLDFVLVRASSIEKELINKILKQNAAPKGLFKMVDNQDLYKTLKSAEVAWCHAGTVTLQAAYCETPSIIAFKEHPWIWKLIQKLRRITFMGLPNIIAGGTICPELIQENCKHEKLSLTTLEFLDSTEGLKDLKAALAEKVKDFFVFDLNPASIVAHEILMIHQINRTSLENQIHMREQAKKNSQKTSVEINTDPSLNRQKI